jgi:arylformamidase
MAITSKMTVYKNKEEKIPHFSTLSTFETGSSYESVLTMSLHTGTHMDYPLHMVKEGAVSTEAIAEGLIGFVKVFETHQDVIDEAFIQQCDLQKGDVVFFKTRNSDIETFDFDFVYVDQTAAKALAMIGIKGVGLDALGIERAQDGHPTHKILLGANIFIIEGLRLKEVPEGRYELMALPLKIIGVEALPMRVLLKTTS